MRGQRTDPRPDAGSRAGVTTWIGGLLALGLLLPVFITPHERAALAALEVDLPALAGLGLRLSSGFGPIVWLAITAVTAAPGWFAPNAFVQRLYLIGGILAVLTLAVLTWSVHDALDQLALGFGD